MTMTDLRHIDFLSYLCILVWLGWTVHKVQAFACDRCHVRGIDWHRECSFRKRCNPVAAHNGDKRNDHKDWKKISEFVSIRSPWLKLVGEKLRDDKGQILDYWRVEKEHSAVILTIHNGYFVLPKPTYRPGVGRFTLDFPGGRIPKDVDCNEEKEMTKVLHAILERELGIHDSNAISTVERLNDVEGGWIVNSSFNNQLLFGFVVALDSDFTLDSSLLYDDKSYNIRSKDSIADLLQDMPCLQCRSVLLNWLIKN